MSDFFHDPELDRLIEELNQGEPSPGGETPAAEAGVEKIPLASPRRAEVEAGDPLERLLSLLLRRGGTDLHLVAGAAPMIRRDGELERLDGPALSDQDLRMVFDPHLSPGTRRRFEQEGAADFSLRLIGRGAEAEGASNGKWRFRVNLHRQRGQLAAALRVLPRTIPSLEELRLPPRLADLVAAERGLVLVTGPSGSGKTTTLAALVGEINRSRAVHIVTIEDPIEYEHPNHRSLVEQIEIGIDTTSFATALKAALRQDPDVILVGEMRDLETVATALTAAETGHLVLATLHTNDVAQALHRIVDVFGGDQQNQIRQQLAMALRAVVSQQLLPRIDTPGRVPAVEILTATYPVRHHIRSNKLEKIYDEIIRGKAEGMISMEESLAQWVRAGVVGPEEARRRSYRADELQSLMRR